PYGGFLVSANITCRVDTHHALCFNRPHLPPIPGDMESAMKPPAQILREARGLIADPARWTQGASARDEFDDMVEPCDYRAVRFCALGALLRVSRSHEEKQLIEAHDFLRKSLPRGYILPRYNDTHMHVEVLA